MPARSHRSLGSTQQDKHEIMASPGFVSSLMVQVLPWLGWKVSEELLLFLSCPLHMAALLLQLQALLHVG